jgi:hypothetical protein
MIKEYRFMCYTASMESSIKPWGVAVLFSLLVVALATALLWPRDAMTPIVTPEEGERKLIISFL